MKTAFALLTLGGILAYAGIKGLSIIEVLAGEKGSPLDPRGGTVDFATPGSPGTTRGPNSGGAAAVVAEADRMIAKKQPYKWGGGHAGFDADGPWDCSGAMSQLCHYLGLLDGSPTNSTGFMRQGEAGRGDVFTIYANPTHVFLIMETGARAGQSWGTTRRFASQGGSLKWHDHTTVGFVARHYGGY